MTETRNERARQTEAEQDRKADSGSEATARHRLIRWIMLAVVVWGVFLATGMWLSTHHWRGPAVVMACVLGFLGFWALMLASRRNRED
ncbi:MAG TPA: hypothetical protein VFI31_03110 [Pirellulales bacterium]|nr:hypothetical protein [Pirellulales bacterium]